MRKSSSTFLIFWIQGFKIFFDIFGKIWYSFIVGCSSTWPGSFSFTDLLHICECFSSVGASCASRSYAKILTSVNENQDRNRKLNSPEHVAKRVFLISTILLG